LSAGSDVGILDAHVHFWDPERLHYAWLDPLPALRRPFLPADLDHGRHQVDGVLFVQADCRADEALAEVEWVAGLAARDARIAGIVAHAPVERGDSARACLEPLAAHPLVVGVRRLLQGEPPRFPATPPVIAGVGLLAELELTFDACVTRDQLPALATLADRCPDVTIVLDHLGKPDVRGGTLDPWRHDLAALALRPNVYCKLSGLTTEADHATWRPADLAPYLDHALDVFGAGRCLAGSDWPVATLTTSAEGWFDVLLAILKPADRHAVLTANAIQAYRLKRAGA
jgi:L-fuconolactonase